VSDFDGKIDFSKYSNEELFDSLQRIDQHQAPINFKAATLEMESRKSLGTWDQDGKRLADVILNIRASWAILYLAWVFTYFVLRAINPTFVAEYLQARRLIGLGVLSILFLRSFCASFKCPKCGIAIGKLGLKELFANKRCIHCGYNDKPTGLSKIKIDKA
jgi:hypothetical protein